MVTQKKTKVKKKFKDTDYYFDDCAVCQYVREMEEKNEPQTEFGLKIAFKKQKQKAQLLEEACLMWMRREIDGIIELPYEKYW